MNTLLDKLHNPLYSGSDWATNMSPRLALERRDNGVPAYVVVSHQIDYARAARILTPHLVHRGFVELRTMHSSTDCGAATRAGILIVLHGVAVSKMRWVHAAAIVAPVKHI